MKAFDLTEVPASHLSDALEWNDALAAHIGTGWALVYMDSDKTVDDAGPCAREDARLWFAERKGLIREAIPIQVAIDRAKPRDEFDARVDEAQERASQIETAYRAALDAKRHSTMASAFERAFEAAS
jgi:hypothetical protein